MDSKPKILLLGPPGAGKTVIANKITELYNIPFVKVGAILRDLNPQNKNYSVIMDSMNKGELAPNELVAEVVKEEVIKYNDGFVLDGWGRQISDLDLYQPNFDYVIYLDCPKEICKDRILNRVVCRIDNSIYSFSETVCSLCGGNLEKRNDDTEETFNNRWGVYENKTKEVIEYFKNKGILIKVDASMSIPEIVTQIKDSI
ncbi:MAG: nucleoside monophosphate kinase [Proteobacteria bacterium]|nr:nucleoside monophosphate kinase [Pseudomonadota bacterium]